MRLLPTVPGVTRHEARFNNEAFADFNTLHLRQAAVDVGILQNRT
jgi:hypothetical protein